MTEMMDKYIIKISPNAIQTTSETLTLEDRKKQKIVLRNDANKNSIESEIKKKTKKFIGNSFDIKFNYYNKIMVEKNGKRRRIISKIPFDWDNLLDNKEINK